MFIWPDGTVTGSIRWGELEEIAAARSAENVTEDGWSSLDALLAERNGTIRETEAQEAEAAERFADDEGDASDEKAPAPAKSDNKAAWVDHAVSQGADREEAESLTKAELVELYGAAEEG